MVPYAKVSSSRFQVDLQQSHFSILNSTSSRLRQAKPTPLDLRSSSRPKSTYWGRLPGLVISSVRIVRKEVGGRNFSLGGGLRDEVGGVEFFFRHGVEKEAGGEFYHQL